MLSGVKFVPRDQLITKGSDSDDSHEAREGSRRSSKKHDTRRRRKKHGRRDISDESDWSDEGSKRRKRRSKKRYSSDDDDSSSTSLESGSESESKSESDGSKRRKSRKKRRRRRRRTNASDEDERSDRRRRHGKESSEKRDKGKRGDSKEVSEDNDGKLRPSEENSILRKEMGLEWMLHSKSEKRVIDDQIQDEPQVQSEEVKLAEEMNRPNPRELNPYFKDNGSGYPDDASCLDSRNQVTPPVIGDGGVSWRLKALKRAKEQAAREGRKLDEVVEERWGSLGQLAASIAARRAAPVHAHLHAIKGRRGQIGKPDSSTLGEPKGGTEDVTSGTRDYLQSVSSRHSEMRKPKQDTLSWRRKKGQTISSEDSSLISSAISGLNKFANDGSFMVDIMHRQTTDANTSNSSPHGSTETKFSRVTELNSSTIKESSEGCPSIRQELSANQLAAKVLQLRMKGKHDEAEKLSREMEILAAKQDRGTTTTKQKTRESTSRYSGRQMPTIQKREEEDADYHLAKKIMHNKQFSMSGRADDEYDFDGSPSKRRHQKRERMPEEKRNILARFATQKERCQFCFENPKRPKHLIISIATCTYMMLPPWQPIVQGHCCILPMQHDSSSRTVDKNVWEELRNFKKCLLMMFAKQDKHVVFLETVVDLAKQHRHCLIECIPIPQELANEVPMYFKKAIDEAEEEWGQHEMKKVIPTSGNLRHVIPENFSYFHVEFGLDRGFVHVIDDESNFRGSFGLNVMRGMLHLPEEDMHRRRQQEPVEKQKQAVAIFAKMWEPFDWTRQIYD